MLLFDAHLDLAWNALSYDRDQTLELSALRQRDAMTKGGASRGRCTVSLPEMRKANISMCLTTVLCRSQVGFVHPKTPERIALDFANQDIASASGVGHMYYYTLLEQRGLMKKILTASQLREHVSAWQKSFADHDASHRPPLGYILSMEGCDPMINVQHAQWWFDQGVRTACLAHYGPSAYAMGTGGDGPLTPAGRELVKEFARLGIILDLVHTGDTAIFQALEIYDKPVFISHGNCRAIVDDDRQISNEQLKLVAARGGVIGCVLGNWMIKPNYKIDVPKEKQGVTFEHFADHIDHVCQITGSVKHVAIGSDLDGGFSNEMTPEGLDSINDIHKLENILSKRGYSQQDVAMVMHDNWVRFFSENLPQN